MEYITKQFWYGLIIIKSWRLYINNTYYMTKVCNIFCHQIYIFILIINCNNSYIRSFAANNTVNKDT